MAAAGVEDLARYEREQSVERRHRDGLGRVLAGSSPNVFLRMLVAVHSGLMQFARTPRSAHLSLSDRVKSTVSEHMP